MTAQERVLMIKNRLQEILEPSYLEVWDESDQHIGHAGHQGGGRHFAVIIAAQTLNQVSKVEAHRLIYGALTDMIPEFIHALKIKIL